MAGSIVPGALGLLGGWSGVAQAVPAAPTGLALVYSGDGSSSTYYPGSPALTWNTASGVTWKLKRSTTSGGGYVEQATGITTNSRADYLASMGTTYYYVVTANDASGQSTNSNQVAVTPRLARTSLDAAHDNGTVAFLWPSVSNASGYRLSMGSSSGNYTTIRTTTSNPASPGWSNPSYTWTGLTPGTYYFAVQATTSSTPATVTPGDSPYSNERSYNIAAAPTGFAAEPINAGAILTWNVVAGATGYRVSRKTGAGGTYADISTPSATSYTDSNPALTNGTQYFYKVMAFVPGGESLSSVEINCTPKVPPAAPTGLTATAGTSQITLSWATTSGATAYRIKRATVSGGTYTTLTSSVATTSYIDSSLTPGTIYYYKIGASNGAWSADSTQVSAVPLAPAPGAPAAPSISLVTNNGLRSTAPILPANATSLTLQKKLTSQADTAYAAVATGLGALAQTDVTGLLSATSYTFRYLAVGSGGNTPGTTTPQTTLPDPPAAPTGLAAVAKDGQVDLSWTASAGATGYNLKRSTISGSGYSVIAPALTGTTYTDTTAANNTSYYYVVTAANAGGESLSSNQAGATPLAPAEPAAPVITNVTATSLTITLPALPARAATLSLQQKLTSSADTSYVTIQSSQAGSAAVPVTGLSPATSYSFRVIAVGPSTQTIGTNATVAVTLPNALAVPTNLAATAGDGQVAAGWS